MDNKIYISYKVVEDKLIFTNFENDVIVAGEVPLYINGVLNPEATKIVNHVLENKRKIDARKKANAQMAKNNSDNAPQMQRKTELTSSQKNSLRADLLNVAKITEKEQAKNKLVEISSKYGLEISNIQKEYEQIVVDMENQRKDLEANQRRKAKKSPEETISLTLEEYRALETYDAIRQKNTSLLLQVESMKAKYGVNLPTLMKAYNIAKMNKDHRQQMQTNATKRFQGDTNTLQLKNLAVQRMLKYPNELSSQEVHDRNSKLAIELKLPLEQVESLYDAFQKAKSKVETPSDDLVLIDTTTGKPFMKIKGKDMRIDSFNKRMNQISEEELSIIDDFLRCDPTSVKLIELDKKINEIAKEHSMTRDDLKFAYTVIRKRGTAKKQNNTAYNISNDKLSYQRTKDKLNQMLVDLIKKDLDEKELNNELEKISKDYNITQLQMELLYKNASINKEAEALTEKLHKKLSGKKIPSKMLKKEIKELNTLTTKEEFMKIGNELVIESKKDDWNNFVTQSYHDPVKLYTAVNAMQALQNGQGIKSAHKIIDNCHNASWNAKAAANIVIEFSPYGKEFEKKSRKYLMSRPERLKNFILDKSNLLKGKDEEIEELNPEEAIAKLQELRSKIVENPDLTGVIEPPSSYKAR